MHTRAIRKKSAASFEEMKPVCQVLILHEDFPAYARAVELCRQLMERHASEMDFSIKCWSFIELADPNCARHAAKSGGSARVILLSLSTALPWEVERWLRSQADFRSRQEGVLALLLNQREAPAPGRKESVDWLRALAAQLGLKFQLLVPGETVHIFRPPHPPMSSHPARVKA